MAITYATVDEWVTMVGSQKGLTETQLNSSWLPYGARRVNEQLGQCFEIPFSSNNFTAKQLSIQMGWLGFLETRTSKQDDSQELATRLAQVVTDICSGNSPMITTSGEGLFATGSKFEAFSTTMNYTPTFNMLDEIIQRVDPDRLQDEIDELR